MHIAYNKYKCEKNPDWKDDPNLLLHTDIKEGEGTLFKRMAVADRGSVPHKLTVICKVLLILLRITTFKQ